MKTIVLFGPGPYFKGGLANYNISLARAMDALSCWDEVHLISWTQQYPALIPRDFADTKSKEDKLGGTSVKLHYLTNYNRPGSWAKTVELIREINPLCVVIQWSIALQGLPLGFMVKQLRKNCSAEVLFDLHFVIQKEQSFIDRFFTQFGLKNASGFVVHAGKTLDELQEVFPRKSFSMNQSGERSPAIAGNSVPVIKLFHPVYDMFKPDPSFDTEAEKRRLGLKKHVFLFFGFIRKYKGLHFCIDSFARLAEKRDDVSLLVVGESFWKTLDETKLFNRLKKSVFRLLRALLSKGAEDETRYNPLSLIEKYGIQDRVVVVNDFVPNEEVFRYFQVSNAILLFYEYATPSGVESMAYNFAKPILASRVGHFPETIEDGKNGYLANAADVEDMARVMEKFLQHPVPEANMKEMAEQFSWQKYAEAISRPWMKG
jgi:glycosyltransferase involved in cell wall biosynthesis